jgi:hypothetical protein
MRKKNYNFKGNFIFLLAELFTYLYSKITRLAKPHFEAQDIF